MSDKRLSVLRRLLLRPRCDRGGALHDRPFVVGHVEHGEAVLPVVLPCRAIAVLRQLPGALALGAGLADRLARHLAVGGEHHLVADALRGRGGERLAGEKRRLNFARRQFSGGEGRGGNQDRRGNTRERYAHECSSPEFVSGDDSSALRKGYFVPGLVPAEFAPPGAAEAGGAFPALPGLAAPSLADSAGWHGPMQNSTPSLLRKRSWPMRS